MTSVYRISVAIGLQNNVSSALKVIQRDVLGLGAAIDMTQGKFNSMKLAVMGAGAVFAGGLMLDGFKHLAAAGGAVLDAQQKMVQLGISHRDIMKETAVAYQNIGVAGSTPAGNLDNLRKLRSVLGTLPAANSALAGFDKAQFVLSSAGYSGAQLDQILKAMDIQGAFVNKKTGQLDPGQFNSAIRAATAAIMTTGGLLTGQQLYQAVRLMGPAASAQTAQGFLGSTTEILASMGNRGARGLQDAAPLLIGGSMSGAQAKTLERLGLLNAKDVGYMGGGRYLTNTDKMRGGGLLAKGDIVDWLHSVFLPAAAAVGLNPLQAGATLTKPLAGVISFLGANWAQVARSGQQQAQAAGAGQYGAANQMLNGAEQNFQSALFGSPGSPGGLMQALGVPAAGMAVSILNKLTVGIREFTGWIGAHPNSAALIDKTLLALGAGLTVLGTAAIATGVLAMVGSGGTLVLAAAGITALGTALYAFPHVLKDAERGIQTFLYDVSHPFSAAVQASTIGGASGSRFIRPTPHGSQPPSPQLSSLGNDAHEALAAIAGWINAGAPTNARVVNPKDIGDGALKAVTRALTKPQTGMSGTNLRGMPSGGASLSMLGHS